MVRYGQSTLEGIAAFFAFMLIVGGLIYLYHRVYPPTIDVPASNEPTGNVVIVEREPTYVPAEIPNSSTIAEQANQNLT